MDVSQRTIVLVGMMGAGKTAVGQALAKQIGRPFVDSDAEIENAAAASIAEIFERDGEPFFRSKESQVIRRLLSAPPGVLAIGGGAFLQESNRRLIARRGISVWLRAEPDLLWQRVRAKATRPLLRTPDPRGTLERLTHERAPFYATADLTVDCQPGLTATQMGRRVADALAGVPADEGDTT
jgi:shikimate kinase